MKKMKPILFNTEMVQAILEGRKTQTRRLLQFKMRDGRNPCFSGYSVGEYCTGEIKSGAVLYSRRGDMGWEQVTERVIPRYLPGDILWVRETWNDLSNNEGNFVYLADGDKGLKDKFFGVLTTKDIKWKPSIHMPKASARIFLKVTDVRVERLQDITEEDAKAEGIGLAGYLGASKHGHRDSSGCTITGSLTLFKGLWDSINAKRGFGWDTNPWVWVIQFERVDSNGS